MQSERGQKPSARSFHILLVCLFVGERRYRGNDMRCLRQSREFPDSLSNPSSERGLLLNGFRKEPRYGCVDQGRAPGVIRRHPECAEQPERKGREYNCQF